MTTYYVGAEETGRTLGLFPKLEYFALFSQPCKLGESLEYIRKWKKEERWKGSTLANISAHSIDDLAFGLVAHATTGEHLWLERNKETDYEDAVVVIDKTGEESYLRLDKMEGQRRLGEKVIAITEDGEKICKTYIGEIMEGITEFSVRPYSQVPSDFLGFREHAMVNGWQQNSPPWQWSMHSYRFLARDLKLSEQRRLAKRIEQGLKARYDHVENPVKLIERQTYPDRISVVRK